jgi:alpha/beta superfamily hydrolase
LAHEFSGVPLLVAGFSFGCWVGLRIGCADSRVEKLIGIGTPVNNTDFSYLRGCAKPKLFVHGSNDEFGDLERVVTLVNSLPGENQLVVVEDVDHFFAGKIDELGKSVREWLAPALRHTP